ncbi:DoxX family protein [Microvirga puerhi]|uniref:DoxX family protein n=1 Tax=Microvirga puerhi TaxID=2876078 RepID=A0ABS7VPW5_9HYPH|nr:DoxX family protein [Microvirga puerhi]MBZ6076958.1 DoxX family protein [Microvirga puerhi]
MFTRFQAPVALLARLMLAYIFVAEGWSKIVHYGPTLQYMERYGVPGTLLPLVILTELGGGLLVAFGYRSRWAAFALAGFCVLTALLFHAPRMADVNEYIHLTKDIAIAGGFLLLVAFGPGEWSLDHLQKHRPSLLSAAPSATGQQG